MKPVITVNNMRKSDAFTIKNQTPSKILMKKAGKSIFESVLWKPPVAIICGSGNNAGDGYVLASLLKKNNIDCDIFLIKDKFSEDGKYYFEICKKNKIKYYLCGENTNFDNYNTIVDCILGTGFCGEVKSTVKTVINKINKSQAFIVSADINSGLNGDNGLSNCCVKSNLTISIGTYKTGHFLNQAKDVMENKINCDIGIKPIDLPYYLIEEKDLKEIFYKRPNFSHKGKFGYIALLGGSSNYIGAIKLANMSASAMRSGAGVIKLAVAKSLIPYVSSQVLESTLFPLSENAGKIVFNKTEIETLYKNTKAVCIGMGLGHNNEIKKLLEYSFTNYNNTLIIDADGLNTLSKMDKSLLKNAKCKVILTPHLKEFSNLTGISIKEIQENPINLAIAYAKENNVILLLKGTTTIITDGKTTYLVDKGCPGMATAGSGDVLSGITTAICGYNENNLLLATSAGAYINGLAGELAQDKTNQISMIASDTISFITKAISKIIQ